VTASLALLRAAYPDPAARARAIGVWGGIAGIAAAAGGLQNRAVMTAADPPRSAAGKTLPQRKT
jgi:MFS transporter, DHA2 family, methylenomycin A resistance protein